VRSTMRLPSETRRIDILMDASAPPEMWFLYVDGWVQVEPRLPDRLRSIARRVRNRLQALSERRA